jgi:calcium/calmodulin-dependent protein kinase I
MDQKDHSTAHYRNIKEKYKIEATLGKGSFASVKQAKDRVTKERVAVKVLSKKEIKESDLQAMKLEIDILKQLDHPNIVKLYDVYEDERFICLVMELMQGGELFDEIIERDHFSENEAREAIKALIDAIHYCHKIDITHRDIKPENLLLADKKQGITSMKLADFGLARLLEEDVLASTACGTPGYVAPEILSGKKYGKQCDNWSIGVVLFILLSGSPPFYDEDQNSLFENISKCNY